MLVPTDATASLSNASIWHVLVDQASGGVNVNAAPVYHPDEFAAVSRDGDAKTIAREHPVRRIIRTCRQHARRRVRRKDRNKRDELVGGVNQ